MTREPGFSAAGAHVAQTWSEAVATARDLAEKMGAEAIVVAGGAEIYAQALPQVDRIYLRRCMLARRATLFFLPSTGRHFGRSRRAIIPRGPDDEHPFTFVELERRAGASRLTKLFSTSPLRSLDRRIRQHPQPPQHRGRSSGTRI